MLGHSDQTAICSSMQQKQLFSCQIKAHPSKETNNAADFILLVLHTCSFILVQQIFYFISSHVGYISTEGGKTEPIYYHIINLFEQNGPIHLYISRAVISANVQWNRRTAGG